MPGSKLLGVIRGTVERPRLAYLDQPAPVTGEILALAGEVAPTRVFRFAAPCVAKACAHFDGTSCRLATRIVRRLPTVVDELPECALRPTCRWFGQEGGAACLRCPLVVTESDGAAELSAELRQAADPASPV
jgi:hypothetical protein